MSEMDEFGRWPPAKNGMPSLADLHRAQTLGVMMNRALCGAGHPGREASAIMLNFVRHTDAVVFEYESARETLTRFVSTPPNVCGPLLRAMSHLENCLAAFVRAGKCALPLRKRWPIITGKHSVLTEAAFGRARDARNHIEHFEDDVNKGGITILQVMETGLSIGERRIAYVELSSWIRELHGIASGIVDYRHAR